MEATIETCRQITTIIDGCSVSLNFPVAADNQALERAKDILVSSYFDLHCGNEPRKEGWTHGIAGNYSI